MLLPPRNHPWTRPPRLSCGSSSPCFSSASRKFSLRAGAEGGLAPLKNHRPQVLVRRAAAQGAEREPVREEAQARETRRRLRLSLPLIFPPLWACRGCRRPHQDAVSGAWSRALCNSGGEFAGSTFLQTEEEASTPKLPGRDLPTAPTPEPPALSPACAGQDSRSSPVYFLRTIMAQPFASCFMLAAGRSRRKTSSHWCMSRD